MQFIKLPDIKNPPKKKTDKLKVLEGQWCKFPHKSIGQAEKINKND